MQPTHSPLPHYRMCSWKIFVTLSDTKKHSNIWEQKYFCEETFVSVFEEIKICVVVYKMNYICVEMNI